MTRHFLAIMSICAVGVLRGAPLAAQQGESGASIFGTYCATCHGTSAKGDGPLASSLTRKPADLTQIAKQNGGTFPSERVAQTIDGRTPVKGHGGGEMPIWGDAFAKSTADSTAPELKIRRLVAYLEGIQQK